MRRSWTFLVALMFSISAARADDPPPAEKAEPADAAQATLVESVGLLGGLQLYNTYLNIGILSDAMGEELYDSASVYQLLGSVIGPLDRVEKQFDKLSKLKLSKQDTEALTRMKKVATLLRQQGKELEAYWDKGLPANAKNYETARKAAWKELNALLELEPTEEKLPTPPRESSTLKKVAP